MSTDAAEVLLSNGVSEILSRGARLECRCDATIADAQLVVLGHAGFVLGPVMLLFALAGKFPIGVAIAGPIVFASSLFAAGPTRRRSASVGAWVVDGASRSISRPSGGSTVSFDDVTSITTPPDLFDARRLALWPIPPRFLRLKLRDGRIVSLAKGTGDELRPAIDRLTQMGLPSPSEGRVG